MIFNEIFGCSYSIFYIVCDVIYPSIDSPYKIDEFEGMIFTSGLMHICICMRGIENEKEREREREKSKK